MRKNLTLSIFSIFALFIGTVSLKINAQQSANNSGNSESTNLAPTRKYKKARALQSSTAKKMAKVYEALEEVDEKGEPAPDMETVISILTELRNNREDLKSYDRSVMWNAWAYVYFSDGKFPQAKHDRYYADNNQVLAKSIVDSPFNTKHHDDQVG